ncbi:MAG: hypothetical protein IT423_13240 [Pirellulaceae bacterium]|nr:hypothetical protein [Pirellulaceae bacterium]
MPLRSCLVCLATLHLIWAHLPADEPTSPQLEPNRYQSLAPVQAEALFYSHISKIRRTQREQLRQAASEFSELVESKAAERLQTGEETAASLKAARDIVNSLQTATDFSTGLSQSIQNRSRLSPRAQRHLDRIVERLADQLPHYRQAKLEYQVYLGDRLQKDWVTLTLDEKLARLENYFALAEEQPSWLLKHRPLGAHLPVPKAAEQEIVRFETEKRHALAVAYQSLQPLIQTVTQMANQTTTDTQVSPPARARAAKLLELFSAPYGQDLRGLMLCQDDPQLPAELRQAVMQLKQQYDTQLKSVQTDQQQLLSALQQRLAPLKMEHLRLRDFAALMAIEIRVAEVSALWRPLRIFARRFPKLMRYEDAHLCQSRDDQFLVEFLADGTVAWLDREQVLLEPTPGKLSPSMRHTTPIDGPGIPVGPTTKLEGIIICHTARGWEPVVVVDESPFGVVIHWEGVREPTYILQQRENMRIETP